MDSGVEAGTAGTFNSKLAEMGIYPSYWTPLCRQVPYSPPVWYPVLVGIEVYILRGQGLRVHKKLQEVGLAHVGIGGKSKDQRVLVHAGWAWSALVILDSALALIRFQQWRA